MPSRPGAGAAADPLAELAAAVGERLARARRPSLVGIAGGVAAGKSTLAAALAAAVGAAGARVEVLCTDAFLLPNEVLAQRGLSMRKGFPETFDEPALVACLEGLRAGERVEVPVYSHSVYDRVPGVTRRIEGAEVVIVEGVNVLQPGVAARLDLAVYLDAEEAHLREWYASRFLELCEAAEGAAGAAGGSPSFYAAFRGTSAGARRAVAEAVWRDVNGVNLRHHILPTRARAAFVLRKARDHTLVGLERDAG